MRYIILLLISYASADIICDPFDVYEKGHIPAPPIPTDDVLNFMTFNCSNITTQEVLTTCKMRYNWQSRKNICWLDEKDVGGESHERSIAHVRICDNVRQNGMILNSDNNCTCTNGWSFINDNELWTNIVYNNKNLWIYDLLLKDPNNITYGFTNRLCPARKDYGHNRYLCGGGLGRVDSSKWGNKKSFAKQQETTLSYSCIDGYSDVRINIDDNIQTIKLNELQEYKDAFGEVYVDDGNNNFVMFIKFITNTKSPNKDIPITRFYTNNGDFSVTGGHMLAEGKTADMTSPMDMIIYNGTYGSIIKIEKLYTDNVIMPLTDSGYIGINDHHIPTFGGTPWPISRYMWIKLHQLISFFV